MHCIELKFFKLLKFVFWIWVSSDGKLVAAASQPIFHSLGLQTIHSLKTNYSVMHTDNIKKHNYNILCWRKEHWHNCNQKKNNLLTN